MSNGRLPALGGQEGWLSPQESTPPFIFIVTTDFLKSRKGVNILHIWQPFSIFFLICLYTECLIFGDWRVRSI